MHVAKATVPALDGTARPNELPDENRAANTEAMKECRKWDEAKIFRSADHTSQYSHPSP